MTPSSNDRGGGSTIGVTENIEAATAIFFSQASKYVGHMTYMPEFKVDDIDGPSTTTCCEKRQTCRQKVF